MALSQPVEDRTRSVERIDIALGFDDRYAPHAGATIASICAAGPSRTYRFILLSEGVSDARKQNLEAVAPGHEFVWVSVRSEDMPIQIGHEHFSTAILYRLCLDLLAPADTHRLIYLDVDLIVVSDLEHLWRVDLGGTALGAVGDGFVDPAAFARLWNLPEAQAEYFNSGVLLFDLDEVRRTGALERARGFIAEHGARLRFTDQDALNFAFFGAWRALDVAWNAQRHMAVPALIEETSAALRLNGRMPHIVHFTGPEKPWLKAQYHPWAWLYWKHLAHTPFDTEIAAEQRMSALDKLKLWGRWMLRRPRGAA